MNNSDDILRFTKASALFPDPHSSNSLHVLKGGLIRSKYVNKTITSSRTHHRISKTFVRALPSFNGLHISNSAVSISQVIGKLSEYRDTTTGCDIHKEIEG